MLEVGPTPCHQLWVGATGTVLGLPGTGSLRHEPAWEHLLWTLRVRISPEQTCPPGGRRLRLTLGGFWSLGQTETSTSLFSQIEAFFVKSKQDEALRNVRDPRRRLCFLVVSLMALSPPNSSPSSS